MKTNRLFWALGYITMGSLAALQGCGGDDDDEGTGGDKGGGGSKATGGSGGKGGTSGSSGGGTAGKGGSSGSAGTTGGTGTSGAAGAPGGAGGEGGGGSGDREAVCADYCEAYYGATPGDDRGCSQFDGTNSYTSEDDCNMVCVDSDWEIGRPNQAGDTINCRLWHATLAAMGDADNHCGHASEVSTGICN